MLVRSTAGPQLTRFLQIHRLVASPSLPPWNSSRVLFCGWGGERICFYPARTHNDSVKVRQWWQHRDDEGSVIASYGLVLWQLPDISLILLNATCPPSQRTQKHFTAPLQAVRDISLRFCLLFRSLRPETKCTSGLRSRTSLLGHKSSAGTMRSKTC